MKPKLLIIAIGSAIIALLSQFIPDQHVYEMYLSSDFEFQNTVFTTTNLHIRTGPSTDYDVLGVLEPGTVVNVIESEGIWLKILIPTEIEIRNRHVVGWISSRFTINYTDDEYQNWFLEQNQN